MDNISFDEGVHSFTDSNIRAENGSITVKGGKLVVKVENGDEYQYGVTADQNINIKGGWVEINSSYLEARGDVNITGGEVGADEDKNMYGDITSQEGNINYLNCFSEMANVFFLSMGESAWVFIAKPWLR